MDSLSSTNSSSSSSLSCSSNLLYRLNNCSLSNSSSSSPAAVRAANSRRRPRERPRPPLPSSYLLEEYYAKGFGAGDEPPLRPPPVQPWGMSPDPFYPVGIGLGHRLPPIVKCSSTKLVKDEDYCDVRLFDKIIKTPDKIAIPHSIPDKDTLLDPHLQLERSIKAESIKRLLSKSSVSSYCPPPGPHSPPPPPAPSNEHYHTPLVSDFLIPNEYRTQPQTHGTTGAGNSKSTSGYCSGNGSGSSAAGSPQHTQQTKGILPSVRRPGTWQDRGKEQQRNFPPPASRCDWSLAGVTVSPSSANSSPVRRSASRVSAFTASKPPKVVPNFGRNRQSASLTRISDLYPDDSDSDSDQKAPERKPWNSSQSLSLVGHSDPKAEREHLLRLQQSLARQVAEKSRLVAARAIIADPATACSSFEDRGGRSPSPPPSPPYLPVVQVRESFFT